MYISENPENDKYKLILIMNRDEYFKRPTAKLDWKEDILAGRDLEPGKEGGTWVAINRRGHIGLLTNIYAGRQSPGAGRGFLIINALKENNPEKYLNDLNESDVVYSPFNLLLLNLKENRYEGNYYCRGHEGCYVNNSIGPFKLEPGFHGLSNHPKTSPYKKTEYGLEKMKTILHNHNGNEEELCEKLFEMMSDKNSHFPDEQMMKQGGKNSPMAPYHPKLACINVDISERGYGTRVTTLILVSNDNFVTCIEKSTVSEENTVHKFQI